MRAIDKLNSSRAKSSRDEAEKLISRLGDAIEVIRMFDGAKISDSPLKRTDMTTTIVSGPTLELIGVAHLEINQDGNIVQVERMAKGDGE